MSCTATTSLARQLGALFEGGSAAGLTDRQLLERITARGEPADEAAFAAIVARHGPMVLGVCRQLLGDHHHAEDAFQATFLALARQARSIRDPDSLGPWLYGVALRTARKARGRLARHRQTEGQGALNRPEADSAPPAERALLDRERSEALHGEIDRLPGAFRLPVVLCYFEGLTLDEAAHRMRWPVGTLRSRLARAREKLRRGLIRRGVALPAAALEFRSAPAPVSSLLRDSTARAATAFAACHAAANALSATPAALAQEVLRTMLLHKLKLAALSLCLLAIVATGAGWLIRPSARAGQPQRAPAASQVPIAPKRNDPDPSRARMTVAGRVLDPQGKTVTDASVLVVLRSKFTEVPQLMTTAYPGTCDRSGRFGIDMPRTTSARHESLFVMATAPSHGVGWTRLGPDEERPTADITLRPEQIIRGRMFDLQGQPARGVALWVHWVSTSTGGDLSTSIIRPGSFERPWRALPGWPGPAVSDDQGQFTLHGLGPGLLCQLVIEDSRHAPQTMMLQIGAGVAAREEIPGRLPVTQIEPGPDSKPLVITLQAARTLTGRVTYGDTGRPVPHALVMIGTLHSLADGDGWFRAAVPIPAVVRAGVSLALVRAQAPDGEPYLVAVKSIQWPKGAVEQSVDIALTRGTVLRGKVVEEGTGQPVVGARVQYVRRPVVRGDLSDPRGGPGDPARTGPDGSYQLVAQPKPGTLLVLGPSEDYVFQETSQRMVLEGRPGGPRLRTHTLIPCDLKPGTDSREVNAVLRRGTTVTARIVGPDGGPVRTAWALSRLLLAPQRHSWREFTGHFHGDVHDGRFELHGLAPDAEIPVFFLDSKNDLGATAVFSVKAAKDGPITVRLEPCGTAKGRLVDREGKPLANYRDPYLISMTITPGASRTAADKDHPASEGDFLLRIDPDRYANLTSDAQGRVTFPALIPGATYRIRDITTQGDGGGPKIHKEFVARAGETTELGDIPIAKPEQQ
jgi:RNA polymerase sigma factor (sigma-70 family)